MSGPPHRGRVNPRSATIHSGRDERWGGGPCRGPAQWPSESEERHDSLGARRALGVWGGPPGPPHSGRVNPGSAPRDSGGEERRGAWGARSGPNLVPVVLRVSLVA